MSPHELSRVIDFLRKMRQPFDSGLPGAKPDPFWNMVLELVDCHLHQVPVTMTTLIELSQASYGAGNRLIAKMIEDGQIMQSAARAAAQDRVSGTQRRIAGGVSDLCLARKGASGADLRPALGRRDG